VVSSARFTLCFLPARHSSRSMHCTPSTLQDSRIVEAVIARPSLLGLEVDKNLEKIIDYLRYIETPPEQIVKYLLQSI